MSRPGRALQREAEPWHVPREDQDLLDVAYVAQGASQALEAWPARSEAMDRFEGQLGYIQACIDQAPLLHRLWLECGNENGLVWCYEVAGPFGARYGRHLLAGGDPLEAEAILRAILAPGLPTPSG
ncbi:hypothetical protein [Stenotrophomonas maltophilia]|uniref:hypothetical protein n=1 Tax=Stenotrophomonas maltophilia TaxID=40324 RepID=UPI002B1DFD92|nr:hypothetical protein [Stenotrophomonas maltophilia]